MKKLNYLLSAFACSALFVACDNSGSGGASSAEEEHGHAHEPGETGHAHEAEGDHDHAHEEVALGTFDIGGVSVEAAQGHGAVEAGKEGHLVIKLPYNDKGETTVRAWVGTEDRTLSSVGKGEYAPSHDDYDIHAVAPDPLPAGAKWWLEIEKPDGAKVLGSIPLLKDAPKTN